MSESKDFSAEAGSAKVTGTISSTDIAEPLAPPLGMRAVGPRITFHFAGEWDTETSYVLYDVVRVSGTSYIANKPSIAKGVNPETDNEIHWVKWNDPNAQLELLQQVVNGFDARITEAETDTVAAAATATEAKKASADNVIAINAEATRAKAAESANKSAIESEATRAKAAENANKSAIAAANAKIDNFESAKNIMLAFGDSFGDEDGEWPSIVAKTLGCTLDNFCKGGATWPFTEKLNEAGAKYRDSASKNKIAFAIAYGGINSTINAPFQNADTIKSFIASFNEAFPNVPLYIAPLSNCSPYNTNFPNAYTNTIVSAPKVYRELKTYSGNFILLEGSQWFNTGSNDLWKDDDLHPSANGSAAIANNIVSAMHGNNSFYQELEPFGNWWGSDIIIETPGYITQYGIVTPRIKVNSVSTRSLYFKANGFYLGENVPMRWYDYDKSTSTTTIKELTAPPTFMSDKQYPQMFISIDGLSFASNHYAIIPSQFVPFGIKS